MASSSTSSDVPTQTLARKRRKEILASQKVSKRHRFLGNEEGEKRDDGLSSSEHIIPKKNTSSSKASCRTKNKVTCKAKVIISNTKYQNRYEPEVQMSKEEEAEWRREARRQRNRESAANSRNKVRNRIHELEKEVEDWKEKHASLLKRIDLLEKKSALASKTTIDIPSCVSTCSEEHHDLSVQLVPCCTSSNDMLSSSRQQRQSVSQQNVTNDEDHHVIEIKSRPAVKIPDGDLQQIVTNVMNDWNIQNDNYPSINRMQLDYSSESFSDGADEGHMGGDMRVAKEICLDDSGSYLNSMDNMNDALHDFDLSEDEIDILISL